ncbi:helix-turn-helix domain-containing protein [Falsarthrobacter nasiphocae]|uniref:Excisionase family DNA binding protein n=1 Tax=Falsarthrobacter nasiphocae TaxID=189863 RepID=A0AAE3YFL7_9MICC|nr:helix-turn-helix domain-containing protein [Falsarthrobacter nasiphocae]MDR6891274.1 excisionase family DNA binding protein [Falsarthrobacter nasiphocae]
MASIVSSERSTFIPSAAQQEELEAFSRFLENAPSAANRGPAKLVSQTGEVRELPAPLYRILVEIVDALSAGRGVSVMPNEQQMTTQQAADFLAMSRPSLVKLLESGDIPFIKVGRHRRVKLSDLVAYESRLTEVRRELLDSMSQEGFASGHYFQVPTQGRSSE